MSFATQLKILRARHNVTQKELADYLNVARPTIAGYETKGKEPDYHTLLLLSSYFHASTDYLLTGKEFPDSITTEAFSHDQTESFDSIHVTQAEHDRLITQIIEHTSCMNNADLTRMLEYAQLLLLQPQYTRQHKHE